MFVRRVRWRMSSPYPVAPSRSILSPSTSMRKARVASTALVPLVRMTSATSSTEPASASAVVTSRSRCACAASRSASACDTARWLRARRSAAVVPPIVRATTRNTTMSIRSSECVSSMAPTGGRKLKSMAMIESTLVSRPGPLPPNHVASATAAANGSSARRAQSRA